MKRYQKAFQSKLSDFDFSTLENSEASIYALSRNFELVYFNPAFIKFAKRNNPIGKPDPKFALGKTIKNTLQGKKTQTFYLSNYKKVLDKGEVWHHEYECSSKDEYRVYHQMCYPLKHGDGMIIKNTLKVNLPMDTIGRKEYQAIHNQYLQSTGFITQCSNCRHTQSAINPDKWHWVPAWVDNMPVNASHSICPTCFDYFWKYSGNR